MFVFLFFYLTITVTLNPYPRFVAFFLILITILSSIFLIFNTTVNHPNPYPQSMNFFFLSFFFCIFFSLVQKWSFVKNYPPCKSDPFCKKDPSCIFDPFPLGHAFLSFCLNAFSIQYSLLYNSSYIGKLKYFYLCLILDLYHLVLIVILRWRRFKGLSV